ncbi:MAG: undecaprenyl-diphosphate phosphatase [Syntrophaceae bacterium]|nr:undecaprenyl-diphosphate phosphatase [Syntrophaceae bacterium]
MTFIQAVVLGIVQGLTELLPVSSSAHLVIAQSYMPGFHQPGVLFDAVLHLGTLTAVVFFFRTDLVEMAFSLALLFKKHPGLTEKQRSLCKLFFLIIVSTVVTGIIGITFQEQIELLFASLRIAASMLFVTGLLLFLSDRVRIDRKKESSLSIFDAVIIGLAQGIALVPGISRSGATITCGIFLGLSRETAARYSFIMSIPAILGAVILQFPHFSVISGADFLLYLAGFMASLVTGFFSLKLLYYFIKKATLRFFAYYCWLIGTTVLISSLWI